MNTRTPVVLLVLSTSCLLADNAVPQVDSSQAPKRELTLLANPAAFPASATDIAKTKERVLKAEQAAAVARIAAIEARTRQLRDETELRIKMLNEERDALLRREKEISSALEALRP